MEIFETWISWIKRGLELVMVSILVNGSPIEEFPTIRRFRQRDPITPFFFLVVVEGLSVLMRMATRGGLFLEYKVGVD